MILQHVTLITAVTIGFDVESFNGTEGSWDPLKICAVMMEGSLERLIPVYVTTHAPGATATGKRTKR